jgi:hypothetical protein
MCLQYTIDCLLQVEDFKFALSLNSMLAASITMYAMLCIPKELRQQVRPTLMLVLVSLDFASSFFYAVANLPIRMPSSQGWNNFFVAVGNIGVIFSWTSYTWSCLVAHHVYAVMSTEMEVDGERKRRYYKRYCCFTFVSMGCCFTPLFYLFARYKPFIALEGASFKPYDTQLETICLILQYAYITSVMVRIHMVACSSGEESRKFKQQVRRFMFAFLSLTFQYVVLGTITLIAQSRGSGVDLQNPLMFYLFFWGESFILLIPLANALIWGMSRTCLEVLISKSFP